MAECANVVISSSRPSSIKVIDCTVQSVPTNAFVDLTDTPVSYVSQQGKIVKVNATEDGLIFGDPSGSSVSWGDIAGTLSDQTDIQNELDAKSPTSHNHNGLYTPLAHSADANGGPDGHVSESDRASWSAAGATAHNHANKTLLDTYNQDNVDITDAVAKRHSHTNKAALDQVDNTGDGTEYLSSDGTYKIPAVEWGAIGGTLSDQTDLQTALDGKTPIVHSTGAGDGADAHVGTQDRIDWNDAGTLAHDHTNKALLDTYDQSNTDLADAVTKKHDHANKAAIDQVDNTGDGTEYLSSDGTYKIPAVDAVEWGAIGGTLSDQTDLQTALDTKANSADLGTASTHDVPAAGDAADDEVVLGNDSRLGTGGEVKRQVVIVSADRAITVSDDTLELACNSEDAITLTMDAGLPINFEVVVTRLGAGTVTIDPDPGDDINGGTAALTIDQQYQDVRVRRYS